MNNNFSFDISALTPDNQAVRDLSELIFLDLIEPGKLDQILDINLGVRDGKKVAVVHAMPEVMVAMQGCGPTYGNHEIPTTELEWEIDGFGIYEKICANDIIGSIMKYMRDKGINSDDLTQDVFVTNILRPMLEDKIVEEIFRMAIFGDKTLTVYDANDNTTGKLETTKVAANWNFMNGIWKRIEDGVAAQSNPIKRVTISQNATATYALQNAFITTAGAAKQVLLNMKIQANTKLRTAKDRQFVVTQSFADAIEYDMLVNNNSANFNLPFTELFAGIKFTEILGEKVIVVPQLDAIINSCFVNTDYPHAAAYLPHRAIFYSLQNLKWGTESGGLDNKGKVIPPSFAELKVWYDETSENTYFKVKDTAGTAIVDNDMVVVAY